MDVRAITKVGERVQNRVKRPTLLKRDESWNVLDEHRTGLELIDETQIFAEKMVPRVGTGTNRGVYRESLAGRTTGDEIKSTDLDAKVLPDLTRVDLSNIRYAHLGVWVIASIGLRIAGNNFRGKQRMKAGFLKTLREATSSRKKVNACQLISVRHFIPLLCSVGKQPGEAKPAQPLKKTGTFDADKLPAQPSYRIRLRGLRLAQGIVLRALLAKLRFQGCYLIAFLPNLIVGTLKLGPGTFKRRLQAFNLIAKHRNLRIPGDGHGSGNAAAIIALSRPRKRCGMVNDEIGNDLHGIIVDKKGAPRCINVFVPQRRKQFRSVLEKATNIWLRPAKTLCKLGNCCRH